MPGKRFTDEERLIVKAAAASGQGLADLAARLGRTERALRVWSARNGISWSAAPRNRKRPGRKPKATPPAPRTRKPKAAAGKKAKPPRTELEAQQLLADIGAGKVAGDGVQVTALRAFIESRRTNAEAEIRASAERDAANLVVDVLGELDGGLVPKLRAALRKHLDATP